MKVSGFILVLSLVCIALISCPASATVRDNFQDYDFENYGTVGSATISPYQYATTGAECIAVTGTVAGSIISIPSTSFDYAAFDGIELSSGYIYTKISIYDSSYNLMDSFDISNGPVGRYEIKMIGGIPTIFSNGIQIGTMSPQSINPSHLAIGLSNTGGFAITNVFDNILIGGDDHHVVGALPSNWTIIRDLLNPSSTGVYAWNNASQAWVLKNSNYFYLDADTSSRDNYGVEYFDIICDATGNIVSTTTINSTASPRNQIQYSVSDFINTAVGGLSQLPDGSYTAEFRGYPTSAAKFWLISQGAAVSWDQTKYPTGSTATVTYSVSSSYWDTSTYSYSLKTVNIYGTAVDTYDLSSSSGSQSIELTDTKYPAGVYYAEIIATKISDSSAYIMNYAATETTAYVYVSGYIMNEETGTVISGARVNVTQSGTTVSYTSDSSGAWGNSSQYWLTGPSIYLAANKSGFYGYSGSLTPLAAGNIARNISMQPLNESYSGVAINGVNSDTKYGNPIPNATIYLRVNGTSDTPQQTFTNIAGYYIFNNLVNGVTYDIWPEKTGFLNSVGLRQVTARGSL